MPSTLPEPSPESDWTSKFSNTKRLRVLQQKPMYRQILSAIKPEMPEDVKHLINMLVDHCITLEVAVLESWGKSMDKLEFQASVADALPANVPPPPPYDDPLY